MSGARRQARRPRRRRPAAAVTRPPNWFDAKTTEAEVLGADGANLDDPVALAGRFLADSKWRERADVRMARCEQLLTGISARSGSPGSDRLLSFHSEIFMLGGGDARVYTTSAARKRRLAKGGGGGSSRARARQRSSPIKYRSPLQAPRQRQRRRPNSANAHRRASSQSPSAQLQQRRQRHTMAPTSRPAAASPQRRRRPHSAARLAYVMTGATPSDRAVRPYSAALPLQLDLPWMRLQPERAKWRASWEPDQPLMFTSKEQLQPLPNAFRKKRAKRRKKRRKELGDQHWVVDLAAQRRRMLMPMLSRRNRAAVVIQNFFLQALHSSIRDKWMAYRDTEGHRLQTAAVRIQKVGRGHIVRSTARGAASEAASKAVAQREAAQHAAATVIQNAWRSSLSWRRVLLFRKVVLLRKKNSIRRIQRKIRARNVRRGVGRMVSQAGAFGAEAVLKMQGLFRGKLARRKTSELKEKKSWLKNVENAGAYGKRQVMKMQGLFRGRLSRKKTQKLKEGKEEVRDEDEEKKGDKTWTVRGFVGRKFSKRKKKGRKGKKGNGPKVKK